MTEIAEGSSLISIVTGLFTKAIRDSFPDLEIAPNDCLISQNTNAKMKHDYQCNSAMGLTKKLQALRGKENAPKNPRECGQIIIDHLPESEFVEKTELAGPGFINLYLKKSWVAQHILNILNHGFVPPPTERKRVIIDYSSPNIAKDMHVGHLRSTIIGDSLARILEFCGHEVIRINHVGDWGTQFGMLIAHLQDIAPDFETNPPSIEDLTVFYKAAKCKFDEDKAFQERAHQEVVNLQSGVPKNLAMWKTLCSVSEKMFSKVYKMLNVDPRLKMMGESFYNPLLPAMVQELDAKGLLQDSDGAKVMFPKGFEVPLIIQKSDGGFGYDSTDMTAIKYRIEEMKADWIIYVVDSGQSLHFQQVFQAARDAGWVGSVRLDHVGFGVVQGEDKKKFKTRAGKSVRLVDLLNEAAEQATAIMKKRVEDGVSGVSDPKEIEEAAAQLGYGGVKYFDLRQNRLSDYVFSFERMLSPDGDTNVYLQYSHARCMSIIRKAPEAVEELKQHTQITLEHPSEWDLACYILRFSDVLEQVPVDLMPNRICKYIYDLSIKLNGFYRDCRVIGSPEQNSRLLLVAAAEKVMRQGFDLLGIVTLDKIWRVCLSHAIERGENCCCYSNGFLLDCDYRREQQCHLSSHSLSSERLQPCPHPVIILQTHSYSLPFHRCIQQTLSPRFSQTNQLTIFLPSFLPSFHPFNPFPPKSAPCSSVCFQTVDTASPSSLPSPPPLHFDASNNRAAAPTARTRTPSAAPSRSTQSPPSFAAPAFYSINSPSLPCFGTNCSWFVRMSRRRDVVHFPNFILK